MVKWILVKEATGLGCDHPLWLAFSYEFWCSDHPMWLLQVSEFVRLIKQDSPECVRFSMWLLFCPYVLLWTPLNTDRLPSHLINALEQHSQVWYMLPPKSKEFCQPLFLLVIGDTKYSSLCFTEMSWHASDYWISTNFLIVSGAWNFYSC